MHLATTHHGPKQNPQRDWGERAEALARTAVHTAAVLALAWTAVHTAAVLALPGALALEPHKPLSAKPRALCPSLSHRTLI